jgi:hypothetical protein
LLERDNTVDVEHAAAQKTWAARLEQWVPKTSNNL